MEERYAEILRKFPEREYAGIVMNPLIMSGQPCIKSRRIGTHILAGRFIAGESVISIAEDYEIGPRSVDEAIRFELVRRSSRVWWKLFGYTENPLTKYLSEARKG